MAMMHTVVRRKLPDGHNFAVVRTDGRIVTRRRTMLAADEACAFLMRGYPVKRVPKERDQILRRLPPVKFKKMKGSHWPYAVVREGDGFVLKRFLLDFEAKWWQKAYMWRRQQLMADGVTKLKWSELVSLLDELEKGRT